MGRHIKDINASIEMIFGQPVKDPWFYERKFRTVFGGPAELAAANTVTDLSELDFKPDLRKIGESAVFTVSLPASYWNTFLPQFEKCRRQMYMHAFGGQRSLQTLETGDFGMPFLLDLFRENPPLLEEVIRVADTSMTMEMQDRAIMHYGKWYIASKHEAAYMTEPDEVDPDADPGIPYAAQGVTQMGYGHQFGHGFSHVPGVRVLIHSFVTKPNQSQMDWHVDDLDVSFSDGRYSLGTLILPGSQHEDDEVCTELSQDSDFRIAREHGIWLPCNVLHRGRPTQHKPRHTIMVEFVAFGRNHYGNESVENQEIKDWLGLTMSQLLEMRDMGQMQAAAKGSMRYTNNPMQNPFVVALC